jgi:hypothetical protein
VHSADVIVSEPATTVSFTPGHAGQLSLATRHLFDGAFIKVLVRRLHAAHEALAHPRRILCFMKKCEKEASAPAAAAAASPACEKSAADKKLAGAAKNSHIKKCMADEKAAAKK